MNFQKVFIEKFSFVVQTRFFWGKRIFLKEIMAKKSIFIFRNFCLFVGNRKLIQWYKLIWVWFLKNQKSFLSQFRYPKTKIIAKIILCQSNFFQFLEVYVIFIPRSNFEHDEVSWKRDFRERTLERKFFIIFLNEFSFWEFLSEIFFHFFCQRKIKFLKSFF